VSNICCARVDVVASLVKKKKKNKVEKCLPLTKDRSADKEMMKDRSELRKET
jgi:hypothetical protein